MIITLTAMPIIEKIPVIKKTACLGDTHFD
jgi:hypothetical protein